MAVPNFQPNTSLVHLTVASGLELDSSVWEMNPGRILRAGGRFAAVFFFAAFFFPAFLVARLTVFRVAMPSLLRWEQSCQGADQSMSGTPARAPRAVARAVTPRD